MTTHGILVKLYGILQSPERWANHEVRGPGRRDDGTLECACTLQHLWALAAEHGFDSGDAAMAIRTAMYGGEMDAVGYHSVGDWNDTHTHHEVLTAVHKAMLATAPR